MLSPCAMYALRLATQSSRKQKTGVRIVLDNPTQPVSRLAPPRAWATVGDNSPWVSQPLSSRRISVMLLVSIEMFNEAATEL
jgi:hypothetical protein